MAGEVRFAGAGPWLRAIDASVRVTARGQNWAGGTDLRAPADLTVPPVGTEAQTSRGAWDQVEAFRFPRTGDSATHPPGEGEGGD